MSQREKTVTMRTSAVKDEPPLTVRDMPSSERPRERMARQGMESLNQIELLAVLLGRGTRGEPVMVLAQKLLKQFGDIRGVVNASLEELQTVSGIGLAKACQLKAVCQINRIMEAPLENGRLVTVRCPDDVAGAVRPRLKGMKKEHFLTVHLDTRNHITGVDKISMGSLDSSIVHPREVFQKAIYAGCSSVILVHNHPSGDPQPSQEDIEITRRLVEAGKLIGIDVLDHLVVCDTSHVSLKSKGLM